MEPFFKVGEIVRILPESELPDCGKIVCKGYQRSLYGGCLAIIEDARHSYSVTRDFEYKDGYAYSLYVLKGDTLIPWRDVISVGLAHHSQVAVYTSSILDIPSVSKLDSLGIQSLVSAIYNKEKLVLQVNKTKSKLKFNFN